MTTDSISVARTTGGVPELQRVLVTGGAGFIGSNLVDRLLGRRPRVTAYDNFSTGSPPFLGAGEGQPALSARRGRPARRPRSCATADRAGTTSSSTSPPTPTCGSAPTTRAATSSRTRSPPTTCSRRCAGTASSGSRFSSTGSIYGEPNVLPTPEDAPFPVQTSPLRRVSKLAGEGLIQAYATGFGFRATSSASSRSSASATATATCSTSTGSCRADPTQHRGARQRQAAQELPLRPGLRRRDPAR